MHGYGCDLLVNTFRMSCVLFGWQRHADWPRLVQVASTLEQQVEQRLAAAQIRLRGGGLGPDRQVQSVPSYAP